MNRKYFAQLLALSALWGASFPMLRVASPLLGPSTMSMLRIALGTLTLAIIMRAVGQRWPWTHWRSLVGLSVLNIARPFCLYALAAVKLPSNYIALLNSTAVIFGTPASAWLGEALGSGIYIGGALVLVASAMVTGYNPLRRDAPVAGAPRQA